MLTVKILRKKINLSQERLADLVHVTPMYISLIENNKRPLTNEVAERIVDVVSKLDSSIDVDSSKLRAEHESSFLSPEIRSEVCFVLRNYYKSEKELADVLRKYSVKSSIEKIA